MNEIVKLKSGSKYEDIVSYSRVVVAGDMIFVANTAGRNYTTRYIAPDARGQAEQAFKNIEAALAAVGATLKEVVAIRSHIPNREDVEQVCAFLGERFRGIDPAGTVVCTPLAHDEMKCEFEVTAYRRRYPDMPETRLRVQLA